MTDDEKLVKENKSLRTVLAHIPDRILWKDADMLVQGCNMNFAIDSGVLPENVVGKGYNDFNLRPDSIEALKKIEYGLIESGKDYLESEELLNQQGKDLHILTQRIVIRDEKKNFAGMLIIYKDVTEKKRVERELKEKEALLIHSAQLSALGEMSAGIAHEINNPLAIIDASALYLGKLLSRPSIDYEACQQTIGDIQKTIKRISSIISGLSSLSRRSLEPGMLKPMAFGRTLDDVFNLAEAKFRSNGVNIIRSYTSSDLELEFLADSVQLSQVILNLFNNAYDALMEAGLPEKWIELKICKVPSGNVQLRLCDAGKGIPANIQDALFNPFFTTKPVGKGTGIGLSISKTIVERFGGSLRYDNSGPNTCFVIELLPPQTTK